MEDELVSDSLVYRYNPEVSPDGPVRFGGHVFAVHLLVLSTYWPAPADSTKRS